MRRIFISHSSEDAALAVHLAGYLERRGIGCWFTPRDVDPAKDWDQAILEAIEGCSAMLLLFSGKADGSRHVRREVHLADNAKKFLLTLRIEDVQPDKLSYFVNLSQWIDWMDRRDEALERVYDTLRNLVDGASSEFQPLGTKRAQTVSIPDGQKLWLRPSSREFVPAPPVPREKRVLTSNTDSKNAVGYLRMRAVNNGRYDTYHEIIRQDGSTYGYFTEGFSQVAYTYGFVSPKNDNCIFVLNHRFRATESTLSILRRTGWVWTKLGAAKFGVADRHSLAFEVSDGEITHFSFRGHHNHDLFCMNGGGFFLFNTIRNEFYSNVRFGPYSIYDTGRALSPKAPLVAVAISEFERKGSLDDREIYRSTIQIYHIETGERMMVFQLPGDEFENWKIAFSADGKMLRAALNGEEHLFDLVEVG
ncbi:toll/interleukin-1 receptor domain-containing protein [Roseovarius sp. CAU 1744]|uniref:toll/interleukin-1 receptor domain-containing protein n=1 Tax=Roseovarius sp. CAU 1744 TaxID=3140368 RepID=UPI00325A7CDD